MSNSFIASVIRRLNLNLLLVSLAGLLLVFIGLIAGTRYLYNAVFGPFPLDRAELLATTNETSRFEYYVVVEGDDHADTGYTYVSTSDSGTETIEAYYHALLVDDRLLLVKTDQSEIGNLITGALINIPSDVQDEVIAELEREMPDLKGAFLPAMLDAGNFLASGYFGLGVGALVGLLSLGGVGLALYRFAAPHAHPALKKLARFGSIDAVTGEIDSDMAMGRQQVGKKNFFTRRWLVSTVNGLQAVPYRDMIWCYKQVTQHRTNGIPTGKTFAANIYDRFGKTTIITGKEADVHQILEMIFTSAPGVVAGYSDELVKLWNQDRAKFVNAVDERRRAQTPTFGSTQ